MDRVAANRALGRRIWWIGYAICFGVTVALCLLVYAAPTRANQIATENGLAGDPSWLRSIASDRNLNVYASPSSLASGETLHLHVSAAVGTRYRVMVYRLGWYHGDGARLIGCVPSCTGDRAGQPYPVPPPNTSTGLLDAGWPATDAFVVPATAVSGYYLAEAVATTGASLGMMRFYPFVVRASTMEASTPILVQIGVNTGEAYNQWGGKSLYAFNSTKEMPAVKVSFNRPYENQSGTGQAMDSYQLVRFLERAGYDVSYTSDIDTDRNPGELLRHHLIIVDGHDEYWTKGIYDAFDAAREAGVNLASFGADIGTWQNRYEDGDRTIVEYRSAPADPEPDPTLKTVEFQKLATPRPQCELFGVQYRGGFNKYIPGHAPQNYTVTQAAATNPWFAGTGLVGGTVLPSLVGYEWDTIIPGCNVPSLSDLFHWSGFVNADSTIYTAHSGARVFAAGSLDFATGLDEWPAKGSGVENQGLQHFAANLLTDLGGAPPATPEQLLPGPKLPPPVEPAAGLQQITALTISPRKFRAARLGAAVAHPRTPVGARVTYTDTIAGATTFTLSRYVRGRCRRRTDRRHARHCLRRVVLARLLRQDSAGINGLRLTGRLHGHRLPVGRYLLSATPSSGLGARGARSAGFTIIG